MNLLDDDFDPAEAIRYAEAHALRVGERVRFKPVPAGLTAQQWFMQEDRRNTSGCGWIGPEGEAFITGGGEWEVARAIPSDVPRRVSIGTWWVPVAMLEVV